MVSTEDLRTADDLCCACAALASEIGTLRRRILDFGSPGMQRVAWRLEDASDALLLEAGRNYTTIRDDLSDMEPDSLVPSTYHLEIEDGGLDCDISAVRGGLLAHVCWYVPGTGEMLYYSEYKLTEQAYLSLVRGESPIGRVVDTEGNLLSTETARRMRRCLRGTPSAGSFPTTADAGSI